MVNSIVIIPDHLNREVTHFNFNRKLKLLSNFKNLLNETYANCFGFGVSAAVSVAVVFVDILNKNATNFKIEIKKIELQWRIIKLIHPWVKPDVNIQLVGNMPKMTEQCTACNTHTQWRHSLFLGVN